MIENDKLYSMTRGVWNPVEVGSSGWTGAPGGQSGVTTWTISRSTIGETAPSGERSTIAFHGSGTGTNSYYTPIVVLSFTREVPSRSSASRPCQASSAKEARGVNALARLIATRLAPRVVWGQLRFG